MEYRRPFLDVVVQLVLIGLAISQLVIVES